MIPILTSITLENLCQSLKSIYLESCSIYCVWPHTLNLMFMKFVDVTTFNSSLCILTMTCYLILAKKYNIIMVGGCLVCFPALALQHRSACLWHFFFFFLIERHFYYWCSCSTQGTGWDDALSLVHLCPCLLASYPPSPFFVPLSLVLVSDISLRKIFIGVLNIEMYSKHTE